MTGNILLPFLVTIISLVRRSNRDQSSPSSRLTLMLPGCPACEMGMRMPSLSAANVCAEDFWRTFNGDFILSGSIIFCQQICLKVSKNSLNEMITCCCHNVSTNTDLLVEIFFSVLFRRDYPLHFLTIGRSKRNYRNGWHQSALTDSQLISC